MFYTGKYVVSVVLNKFIFNNKLMFMKTSMKTKIIKNNE